MQGDDSCQGTVSEASPCPLSGPLHLSGVRVVKPLPGNFTARLARSPTGVLRIPNGAHIANCLQREVAEVTGPEEPFAPRWGVGLVGEELGGKPGRWKDR